MHVHNKRRQLIDFPEVNCIIEGITTEEKNELLTYSYEVMQAAIDYEDLIQQRKDTLEELDNSCEIMVAMKRKRDCFKGFLELKYRKY